MSHKISVLMSVYNDELVYFKAAVSSIQNQTYKDWELIIINDGDNENDADYHRYIVEVADDRIIYISNKNNQGISVCLNQALDIASGEFIAKMDSDDISLPERFEKQIQYFDEHPECNVLGTSAIEFGDSHEFLIDYNNYSQKMRSILLLFRNSGLIHPSAMMRRKFFDDYNIRYDEHFRKALDYRLWVECTQYSKINCLDEVLFLYRRHFSQISTAGKAGQDIFRDEIRLLQLQKLHTGFTDFEKELHLRLCNRKMNGTDMLSLEKWCDELIKANEEKRIYDTFRFKGILYSEALIAVCKSRKQLTKGRFFRLCIHYISFECVWMLIYNKVINIKNNIKKKLFPITHKSQIQFVNRYIKQISSNS